MTGNVLAFRAPSGREVLTLQSKIECYQKVTREWSPHVDAYERSVLLAVVDRTLGWGKIEASFSGSRLLKGDQWCGPVGMGRTKMYDALASLETKGLIRRRPDDDNPEKIWYSVRIDWSPEMALNLPKRLKNQSTDLSATRTPPVRNTDTPVRHADPIYSNPLTVISDSNPRSPSATTDLNPVTAIRKTVAVTASQNAERAAARRETRIIRNNATGIEAAWRATARAAFPAHIEPVWTAREKGQANRVAKGWVHAKQISFVEFTEWAVTNWTQIMSAQFRWMKDNKPPATPAFSFYVHFLSQFADCWSEGKLKEWQSDAERTRIEKLMGRGMTYEQAVAEDAKANVAGDLRKQMEKREIIVRARERHVDGKLEQAKKLAEFGGVAPSHPRSPAAQRARAAALSAPGAEFDETMPPLTAPIVPLENPFDD